MRITESQLRRIIRQEVRSLTEMPARRPAAGRRRAGVSPKGTAPEIIPRPSDDLNDVAIAQDALNMLHAGEDALESVVPYIVEQTLTYGPDEYHDAESSRPRPEGDRADVIVRIIRRVDWDAARDLADALNGYVHY